MPAILAQAFCCKTYALGCPTHAAVPATPDVVPATPDVVPVTPDAVPVRETIHVVDLPAYDCTAGGIEFHKLTRMGGWKLDTANGNVWVF